MTTIELNDLRKLRNQEVHEKMRELAEDEREVQAVFLLHLREVERRGVHLQMGFGSLFDYMVKSLNYSESAAYRRIQAMRLMKSVPEVQEKIKSGELNLTTAAQVQSFFKAEEKRQGHKAPEEKQNLVASVQNKSSREVERHLLSLQPQSEIAGEKIRQVTEAHVEIKMTITEDLKKKFDRLKSLFSHVHPEMTYQQLFELLADRALKQVDPLLKPVHAKKPEAKKSVEKKCDATPAPKVNGQTVPFVSPSTGPAASLSGERRLPESLKRAVWQRDGGKCTFYDPKTGYRCESIHQIQVDHIKPLAFGGGSAIDNLRLLCAQHNRWRAVHLCK